MKLKAVVYKWGQTGLYSVDMEIGRNEVILIVKTERVDYYGLTKNYDKT